LGKFVNLFAEGRGHLGWFSQHKGENLVAGCYFCKFDVRLQAYLFKVGDLLCRQGVVEILRHGVGVETLTVIEDLWGPELVLAEKFPDSPNEGLRHFAFFNLFAQFSGICRLENVVQIGQKCP
jgi:hypothetical protein